MGPWGLSSSGLLAQIFSHGGFKELPKRMNHTAHELFKPLLTSWLLASYWPKQVTWLSPVSEWEGIPSNIAGRCRNGSGGIWCHFCNLPQLDSLHAKRLCLSSQGCEIPEVLV